MAQQQVYTIGNMDCAHCAQEVETGIRNLQGVIAARVDFATAKLTLEGDVPFTMLQQRVESLGKTISTEQEYVPDNTPKRGGIIGFLLYLTTKSETQFALIGGAIIMLGILLSLLLTGQIVGLGAAHGIETDAADTPLDLFISGMYTLAMAIAAYPIARSGINTLRVNRMFSINLLMTIAAIGAIVIGEFLEAAIVIFLFAIGEALEGYTADRARDSLRSLLALKPTQAILLRDNQEIAVHINDLRLNDRILVKPGERIPMDGVIEIGSSGVNQAPITGESMPVHKTTGSDVFAGSINGSGALEIRVTHLAADNTLSRIIRLVEEAQSSRSPSQRMIDQFAHYYTPGVVLMALLVAIVPPLVFNAPFYSTATEAGWLYRALTMLVIACPCALVISTPVTVISAITAAARKGVLIKGGVHLETLGTVRAIAFDKTGTLTKGQPAVVQIHALDGDEKAVLAQAAAVEQRSTHPLAQAVVSAANQQKMVYAAAENVENLAGQGIRGSINGQIITVGSHSLFETDYPHESAVCQLITEAEANGQTAMLVAHNQHLTGFITAADEIRPTSAIVISQLHELGLSTTMLTGDNPRVAQSVGKQTGVQHIRAGLLPQDKVGAVQALRAQYQNVMMVGDGINDTPALASANVGVAMGGAGSAQAMETADVVLMADDLTQLPFAIQLSRFARQLIVQNIGLSLAMKLLFLMLAATGGVSMWAAIFADVGMSLMVTLNGMRPLKFKA
jgi:Cd2+/Zn2+-exporting ATPase